MGNRDLGWAWKPDIHDNEPIPEIGEKKYTYLKKKGGRYHEIDPDTGKSYCKFENGTSRQILFSATKPDNRKPCGTCKHKKVSAEPLSRGEAHEFYTSHEWATLRYKAFLKYGRECIVCGTSKNLTVDHIKPARKYPELKNDLDNLQVMCRLCNRGKGAWDETDWRE